LFRVFHCTMLTRFLNAVISLASMRLLMLRASERARPFGGTLPYR